MAKKKFETLDSRFSDDIDSQVDAEVLHQVKAYSKLSWSQIAKFMDVTTSHVSRVKDGKKGLTLRRYVKLAKGLKLELSELFKQVTLVQSGPEKIKEGDEMFQDIMGVSSEISKNEAEAK